MKKNILFILHFVLIGTKLNSLHAQVTNWAAPTDQKRHIAGTSLAADFGVVSSFVYGYKTKLWKRSLLTGIEFSFPYGEKIMDDWKLKIGGQLKLADIGPLTVAVRIQGVGRRYKNDLAKMFSFGSDMALTAGYYKPGWFVAAESGFDKAIVTQISHTGKMRENYPQARDGWYMSTGGNFYYGLQVGARLFRTSNIYLRGGKLLEEDFKHSPTLPLYGELGINISFAADR